ncbi:ABC transporter ATP-binding protein [Kribbella sp. NPDC058245]|uniref:ABC transporter ATP-binding protein n=1 Tax=Kribbella sp. NPDC058245 TaxID=3346399 RepID=UPI0036EBDFC1
MTDVTEPLLRVDRLVKHYPIVSGAVRKKQVGAIRAVDGVSFELHRGETLGLVGESGCGKSTLSQTLLRLVEPTAGHAFYRGQDIFAMSREELKAFRRKVQIVFQDPFESLNPRMTIGQIIAEPWAIHRGIVPRSGQRNRAAELLELVGLKAKHLDRYPEQFSGGQRQRIGVARAIALNPEIIICDEPVSALDVSVQAQVVNLLQDLQKELGLSYIFIAHDLGVVRHIADRVAVMYLGKIVEYGNESALFEEPRHPYTEALLSAVPVARFETARRERILLTGEVPSPANPPSGCRFHTRCRYAEDICRQQEPELSPRGVPGHDTACHLADKFEGTVLRYEDHQS